MTVKTVVASLNQVGQAYTVTCQNKTNYKVNMICIVHSVVTHLAETVLLSKSLVFSPTYHPVFTKF